MVWRVINLSKKEKFVLSTLDQIYLEKILEYLKTKERANASELCMYITGKPNNKIGGGLRSKIKVLLLLLRLKGIISLDYEIKTGANISGGPKLQIIAKLKKKK